MWLVRSWFSDVVLVDVVGWLFSGDGFIFGGGGWFLVFGCFVFGMVFLGFDDSIVFFLMNDMFKDWFEKCSCCGSYGGVNWRGWWLISLKSFDISCKG